MHMDLTRIPSVRDASEQGFRFELLAPPNATPTGNFVTVAGPESKASRAFLERQAREEVAREMVARRRGALEPKPLDQREAEAVDFAASLVLRWDVESAPGQFDPLGPDVVRQILQAQPWARGQIIRESSDVGNFVRSSSTSSSPTPPPSSPSA